MLTTITRALIIAGALIGGSTILMNPGLSPEFIPKALGLSTILMGVVGFVDYSIAGQRIKEDFTFMWGTYWIGLVVSVIGIASINNYFVLGMFIAVLGYSSLALSALGSVMLNYMADNRETSSEYE